MSELEGLREYARIERDIYAALPVLAAIGREWASALDRDMQALAARLAAARDQVAAERGGDWR